MKNTILLTVCILSLVSAVVLIIIAMITHSVTLAGVALVCGIIGKLIADSQ